MLSLIIPVLNEKESLRYLYDNLRKTLFDDYEIIFVDDGSIDASLDMLKDFEKANKKVRVFSFRRTKGKAEALTLGFIKAKGDYIATLDADLQDRPEEIPKLLKKAKEGYELVCGWRKNRRDSLPKVISSKFFNSLVRIFWGLKLHDYNCGLKVYKKEVAKSLNLYGGMHRFIPLLCYQQGFTIAEVEVSHEKRRFGKSKYGISKLWKDLPDIFTMFFLSKYSNKPLHFFGTVGAILLFFGLVILGYLSIVHFQGHAIGRRPLLFLGMLLVLSGFQVVFTGFLADLIINLSHKNNNTEFTLRYSSD